MSASSDDVRGSRPTDLVASKGGEREVHPDECEGLPVGRSCGPVTLGHACLTLGAHEPQPLKSGISSISAGLAVFCFHWVRTHPTGGPGLGGLELSLGSDDAGFWFPIVGAG